MELLPAQCRAARALLNWSQTDLSVRARVAAKTIVLFGQNTHPRTLEALAKTLEAAGVVFLEPSAAVYSAVGLRPGVMIEKNDPDATSDDNHTPANAIKALDQELVDFWAARPRKWRRFSQVSRQAISVEMFGSPELADEVFGTSAMD